VELNEANLGCTRRACEEANEVPLANLLGMVAEKIGLGPHIDFSLFSETLEASTSTSLRKVESQLRRPEG
jgi:hypothetical protein